jgi:hypothetical protein
VLVFIVDLTLADIFLFAEVLYPKRAQIIGRQDNCICLFLYIVLRYYDLLQRRVLKTGNEEGFKLVDIEVVVTPSPVVEKKVEKKKEEVVKVDKKKKKKETK